MCPDASYVHSSFLGGEWSPYAQGRIDHPKYRTALSTCLNAYPVEEGACPRRPGFQFAATTRNGAAGRVLPFDFTDEASFVIELTAGWLRMFAGAGLVFDSVTNVISISTATPAIVTLGDAEATWATNDQVQFLFSTQKSTDCAVLRNRQFKITVIDSSHVALYDPVTGNAVPGNKINWDPLQTQPQIAHVLQIATPYSGTSWQSVRKVQAAAVGNNESNAALLLQGQIQPQSLSGVANGTAPEQSTFDLTAISFLDGPYFDAPDGSWVILSGVSGSVTATISYQTWVSTTPYNLGDIVNYSGTLYSSTINQNYDNTPGSGTTWVVAPTSDGVTGGALGFQATDVGRSIRIYNQPLPWSPTFDYGLGPGEFVPPNGVVSYLGVNYTLIASGGFGGAQYAPDISPTIWSPAVGVTSAVWTWGVITAVGSSTSATVQLLGNTAGPGQPYSTTLPNADPAAYNAGTNYNPVRNATAGYVVYQGVVYYSVADGSDNIGNTPSTSPSYWTPIGAGANGIWQLGVYSNTTGWPTCGYFYEGRLWLAGAVPNRADASVSDDFYNFAPTDNVGDVGDANGISVVFNSDDQNEIYWFQPSSQGLLCGTKNGEWLIQASALNDPITPTSIQAHRHTKVGCFNQIPCQTPLTTVFIHKFQRELFEYFPDVFSGKLTSPVLNIFSKHLTTAGIEEIAYQSTLTPIIWARMGDGSLAGWTYRRISLFSNEEPAFVGAHRHVLGSGRTIQSLCVSPNPALTSDTLYATTLDPVSGVYHVEIATQLLDPSSPLTSSWFVDDAVVPSGLSVATVNGKQGVYLYGLWHLNGKTVSVVVGGLDCGDYPVSLGSLFAPFGSDPGQLFTLAYLQSISGTYGLGTYLDDSIPVAPSTGSLQLAAYALPAGADTVSGVDNFTAAPNWTTGDVYFVKDQLNGAAGSGIRHFTIATPQPQTSDVSFATLLPTSPNTTYTGSSGSSPNDVNQLTAGPDGNLYYVTQTGAVNQINPANWNITKVSNSNAMANPGTVAVVQAGTTDYWIDGSYVNATISVLSAATMTSISSVSTGAGGFGSVTVAPQSSGAAASAISAAAAADSLANSTIWRTIISPSGVVSTAEIGQLPFSYDPTALYAVVQQLVIDQDDSNIIAFVKTNNPSNHNWVVKLDTTSLAVLWATQILPGGSFPSLGSYARSRVQGGTLAFIVNNSGHNATIYVFNTNTGTYTTTATPGLYAPSDQVFDSVAGRIIAYVSYDATVAGHPVPQGRWPGTSNWASIILPGAVGSSTTTTRSTIPAVVGFTYTTQGQLVRPALPQDAGAANGPALGKTQRSHMMAALLAGAVYGTLFFGTLFTKLRPANFKYANDLPYDTKTLYDDVYWNTIEDGYSFGSQLCWQINRPLPANVVTLGAFLQTQDR